MLITPDGEPMGDATLPGAPLAARMRPRSFDEYVGQEHLVGEGHILRRLAEADNLPSMILWGPPGTGKTTLGRLLARSTKSAFVPISAVSAGVADLRRVTAESRERLRAGGGRTVLFIDEIHRFNKAQQDAILPFVEDGTVTLIGATTENPSFEVIGPLLSRSRVFALKMLEPEHIERILRNALEDDERGLGSAGVKVDDDAIEALSAHSEDDSVAVRARLSRAGGAAALGTFRAILVDSTGTERARAELPVSVYAPIEPRLALPVDSLPDGRYAVRTEFVAERPDLPPDALLRFPAVRDSLFVTLH